MAATVLALLAGPATAAARTATFGCSGGQQTWTVPASVTEAGVVVDGAAGGSNNFDAAGLGGRAAATVTVNPGDTYAIVVGCEGDSIGGLGSGGFGFGRGGVGGPGDGDASTAGAGGGGGSGVLLGADVLLVGGGGGGSAAAGGSSNPGGGAGGGSTGADGTGAGSAGGGGGATQTGPGPGGAASFLGTDGNPGSGHDGGDGATAGSVGNSGAGGGGGGWYGGGGGAVDGTASAGGGGGSGFAAAGLSATLTPGVRAGDGQVTITFDLPNTAPSADADSYTTAEDTLLVVNAAAGVLANDSDAEGDAMTAVEVSGPSHGSLTLSGDGSFSYAPDADYNGPDSFTYMAGDGTEESGETTVTLTVGAVDDAPVADSKSATTGEDTATTITLAAGDADGDQLQFSIVSGPAHGSLGAIGPVSCSAAVPSDCTADVDYTPQANFNGPDSFSYEVSDGSAISNSATVSITVSAVDDVPTVTVAPGGTCGGSDRSGTIDLTIADADGLAGLSLSSASSNPALVPAGNVGFSGSGAARAMTVTAVSGATGTATITVTVSDGGASSSVSVVVRVGGNGNDTITGGAGTDMLLGQNGDDTLSGQGGIDLLCGARGNDRLTGGTDADRFGGGPGADVATDLTASQGDTQDGTIP